MPDKLVGFIDSGFLKAEGARALAVTANDLNITPSEVVAWLHSCASRLRAVLLRSYWYDASHKNNTAQYAEQRKLFGLIEETAGMQLRLGSLVERPHAWEASVRRVAKEYNIDPSEFIRRLNMKKSYAQKGVDTLLVMDLVRHAQQKTYDYAVLVAGDQDLSEAIRTAQDFGSAVLIAAPKGTHISQELLHLSDEMLWLTPTILKPMLLSTEVKSEESV